MNGNLYHITNFPSNVDGILYHKMNFPSSLDGKLKGAYLKMAVYKEKPIFDYYIAEQALREYYDYYKYDKERSLEQMSELAKAANEDEENLKRIYLRLGRLLCDHRLIGSYLASLSDLERNFLLYRYGKNEKYHWISQKLYVSISSLCSWNNKFLSELSQILSYNLNDKDVFCYLKVINVVRNLDMRINMLLLSQITIDKKFLYYLDNKRKNYRQLMKEQHKILTSSKDSLYNKIIAEKLVNSNDSVKTLCKKFQKTDNVIAWHLRNYENKMKKYL